jgi:hypothetical protein
MPERHCSGETQEDMMSEFIEPDIIWRSDRSYGEKRERVQLERGEFNGRPTYKLRALWQSDDGVWRWTRARETSSGKAWTEFGLKQRELESLGALLLAEAKAPGRALGPDELSQSGAPARQQGGNQRPAQSGRLPPRSSAAPTTPENEDLPF